MEDDKEFDQFLRDAFALTEEDLQEVLHASELPSAAAPSDVFSMADHLMHIEDAPMTAAPPVPAACDSAVGPSQAAPSPPDNPSPRSPAATAKPKRVRKPTQAQRDAHKRFRERRKQQMESMCEEVVAKQQLVQQLQEQKQQLSARLRALEMLIYGGDSAIADLSHQLTALQLQRQATPTASMAAAPAPSPQLAAATTALPVVTTGLHLQQLAGSVPMAAPQALQLLQSPAAAGDMPLPPPAAVTAGRAAAGGSGPVPGLAAGHQGRSNNLQWGQPQQQQQQQQQQGVVADVCSSRGPGAGWQQQQQQQQQQGSGSLPGSTSSSSGGSASASQPSSSPTPGTSEWSGCGTGGLAGLLSDLQQEPLLQAHVPPQQQQQQQLMVRVAQGSSSSATWQGQVHQQQGNGQWVPPSMRQAGAAAAAAAAVSALGGDSCGNGHSGVMQQLVAPPRPTNPLNSRHTPVVAAAAANSDRTLQWQVTHQGAVMVLRDVYKEYLGQVAPVALQAQLQNPPDPALLDRMRQLRLDAFRRMSGTFLLQRIPAYMMYTLNLESGQLHTQAPPHHWEAAAANMAPRIPADRLRDMLNCHATYSTCMARIKGQRQVLLQQLQAVLGVANTAVTRATSRHLVDAEGPYAEAQRLLSHIEANMRREFALEGCLQRVISSLLDPLAAAESCMHSYPYVPDFHHILTLLKQQQQQQVAAAAAAAAGGGKGGVAAAAAEEGPAAAGRLVRGTRRQASVMVC